MVRFGQSSYTVNENATVTVCAELFNILTPSGTPTNINVTLDLTSGTAGMWRNSICCYGVDTSVPVRNPINITVIKFSELMSDLGTPSQASVLLSFPAGSFDGTIRCQDIIPIDDDEIEDDETLQISLSAPTGGANLDDPSMASVTIIDNDGKALLVASQTRLLILIIIVLLSFFSSGDRSI